jgi:hypothetical protein
MSYETADDLAELQALLDISMSNAGEHLRSIYEHTPPITAEELVELLPGMQVIDLATVTASGEPRVSPVDGHLFKGKWHFGSATNSVRARHLAARPAASAAHTRGEGLCVITHGHTELLDLRDPASAEFLAYLRGVYPSFDDWNHLDSPYWVLQPTHMFARRAFEEEASD